MGTSRLTTRATRHEARYYWAGGVAFMVFFVLPALLGYVVSLAFGALSEGNPQRLYWLAGLLVVLEMVRMFVLHWGAIWFTQAWEYIRAVLRYNMLDAQLVSGGPNSGRPVASAGQAITRFRDDTEDVAVLADTWIDVAGGVVFTVIALSVLATVDTRATVAMVLPMAVVGVVATLLGSRLRLAHLADRQATAEVTGLLDDVLSAATTIKANGAEATVLARTRQVMDIRRETAVRSRVYGYAIRSFSQSTAEIGLGLVILVGAVSVQQGRLGPGQLALFLSYGGWLGFLPRMIGLLVARSNQAGVAFDGMATLVADNDPANTVIERHLDYRQRVADGRAADVANGVAGGAVDRDVPVSGVVDRGAVDRGVVDRGAVDRGVVDRGSGAVDQGALGRSTVDRSVGARGVGVRKPLQRLDVVGLQARFDSGGIDEASFSLERGSFTVITGPVGSGKSTLLRALLGLVWRVESRGEVWWNGELIEDRAAFMVPPNAAYLPQVPQLISDSVADNILLGTGNRAVLDQVLVTAAVSDDIQAMVAGVDTLIGPRGLRLSGGQRQRVAAARALVQQPELLVLDDVSSALDVETELELWHNLAAADTTVLAVSHRRTAWERADQVLRVEGGRLRSE